MESNTATRSSIDLINLQGAILKTETVLSTGGRNKIDWDMHQFSPGCIPCVCQVKMNLGYANSISWTEFAKQMGALILEKRILQLNHHLLQLFH